MKVQFVSPFQAAADFTDVGLSFAAGEIKDVPDDIAATLLTNPNIIAVSAALSSAPTMSSGSQASKQ